MLNISQSYFFHSFLYFLFPATINYNTFCPSENMACSYFTIFKQT